MNIHKTKLVCFSYIFKLWKRNNSSLLTPLIIPSHFLRCPNFYVDSPYNFENQFSEKSFFKTNLANYLWKALLQMPERNKLITWTRGLTNRKPHFVQYEKVCLNFKQINKYAQYKKKKNDLFDFKVVYFRSEMFETIILDWCVELNASLVLCF